MEIKTIDHTGDVGFELRAKSLPALFESAMRGLVGVVFKNPPEAATQYVTVSLSAPDIEGLLVGWLNELNYLILAGHAVPASCSIAITSDTNSVKRAENRGGAWRLEADVGTTAFNREDLGFQGEVKSATYHGLAIRNEGNTWHARVILDV